MAEHTKGPWYKSSTGNHQGLIISENTGENIAVSYDKANARLIAAAPELLEACRAMLANMIVSGSRFDSMEDAKAAIEKATAPDEG